MTDHKDARQLLADITAGLEGVTPGPWHPGHLGTDLTCQCSSIVDEGRYAGGIAKVYVGNGKPISDGGNDCPPAAEAAANMRHIARCNPHAMQTIDREFTALTLELSAANQRIAKLEAERQWQPIETAPRDGTIILGKGGIYHGVPFPVKWAPSQYRPDYPWECVVSRSNFYDHCLSHWMPLPTSPHEGTQS